MHLSLDLCMHNLCWYFISLNVKRDQSINQSIKHCIKSVRIRTYSGLYSAWMRENASLNHSENGHFSRTVIQKKTQLAMIFLTRNKWLSWERNNNSKAEAVVRRCIKKETLAQVFCCEFCEISKNTFFHKHLLSRWLLLARKTCSSAECFWNFRNNFTSKNHAFSRSLIILIQAFVCIIIYIKWGWTFCLLLDTRYVLLVVSWYLLFSCSILRISLLFLFVSGNIKLLLLTFDSPLVISLLSHYLLPLFWQ